MNGVGLDPLAAANDARKPLLSKLLAVPSLRARYLAYVRDIADHVAADTRKLDSTGAFYSGGTNTVAARTSREVCAPPRISLRNFSDQRRVYLLKSGSGTNGTAARE